MHAEFATEQIQDKYLEQPTHEKVTMIDIGVALPVGEGAAGKTHEHAKHTNTVFIVYSYEINFALQDTIS